MARRRRLLVPILAVGLWSAGVLSAATIDSEQATQAALETRPGRVLSVERARQDGTAVYRVKILAEGGEVHIILVNGETGEVMSSP